MLITLNDLDLYKPVMQRRLELDGAYQMEGAVLLEVVEMKV